MLSKRGPDKGPRKRRGTPGLPMTLMPRPGEWTRWIKCCGHEAALEEISTFCQVRGAHTTWQQGDLWIEFPMREEALRCIQRAAWKRGIQARQQKTNPVLSIPHSRGAS